MRFRLIILFCLLLPPFGLASPIDLKMLETNETELGISLQLLIPNQLPGFEQTQTVFGPRGSIPVGRNSIELGAYYGTSPANVHYLGEVNYRYNVLTPFLVGYVLAGIQYMHYSYLSKGYNFVGPMTGIGITFPMAKGLTMGLSWKLALPQKLMLIVGGNFAFVL